MQSGQGHDKSLTDWDRLDAMGGNDIDTSDISELDDAFFKNAEVVMPPKKST